MKVKVVCACAVSLGCQFFHQQGEKVDFPLRRNALFGKSSLVPFNEVSKGPDHFFLSHFGVVFVLYICKGGKNTDVALARWKHGTTCVALFIIHYLSPLHIYVVKQSSSEGYLACMPKASI